jgi:methionyl-tRNA formyltransferase
VRGEPVVGITVHRLTEEVDAGPVLFQRPVPVPPRATSATLAPIVDREGASLLPEILALAGEGALPEGKLLAGTGSHVPPLRPEHGLLDFTRSAVEIDRLVRAAQGEIAAYAFTQGLRVLFVEGEPGEDPPPGVLPGRVVAIDGDALVVAASRGAYRARRFVFLDRVHDGPALARALSLGPGAAFSASPVF